MARPRTGPSAAVYGYYPLSSAGAEGPETINATRLAWTDRLRQSLLQRAHPGTGGRPADLHPQLGLSGVSVGADEGVLFAGIAEGCSGAETGHTVWELTDNFGMAAGNHRLTFGIHGELIDLVDDVVASPGGFWSFDSLDSLAQGEADGYRRRLPIAGSQVAFRVNQIGAYAPGPVDTDATLDLDRRSSPRRAVSPHAARAESGGPEELGVNTALTPSGNILWSPRLGVNYDLSGRGTASCGAGRDSSRVPPRTCGFRMVYARTGARALTIDCTGDAAPAFTLDPAKQPTACADPDRPPFASPRLLRSRVSVSPEPQAGGRGGSPPARRRRGHARFPVHPRCEHVPGGGCEPRRASRGRRGRGRPGDVWNHRSGDRRGAPFAGPRTRWRPCSRSGTEAAIGRSRSGPAGEALRQRSRAERGLYLHRRGGPDELAEDYPGPNIGSSPVNGTLEHPELRTSFWEGRHKITLVGTTDLPLGFRLGLTYIGMSGTPFTYVVEGDANADGFRPDSARRTMSSTCRRTPPTSPCATRRSTRARQPHSGRALPPQPAGPPARAEQLPRPLGARDPARLSKRFRLADRRALELTADLFNVLNFLDSDWGLVRRTQGGTSGTRFRCWIWSATTLANGRGVYELVPVYRRQVDVEASRWRMQLGATLTF